MMLRSEAGSLRTRNVIDEGHEFIALARHGQNGSFYPRSSVGGRPCQAQAKIIQQNELPTERMRRVYSCARNLEVEDKRGRLDHLVNSTHFRTMNVREARTELSLAYVSE
jgi:hypothetical protein